MKALQQLAIHLIGTPYKWGGNSPIDGLDCSGLTQILLQAGGADLPGDQTAQELFDHFSKPENRIGNTPETGALLFYGNSPKSISHVAWCYDEMRMIEAGGGDSTVKDLRMAITRNACVRMVPIRTGKALQGIYLPEYLAVESNS